MKLGIFIMILFIISFISASCEEGQIDINSGSLGELDALSGIGPSRGQAIIDFRDSKRFDSVNELIDVYGIGPVTLGNIIEQGMACVGGEEIEQVEVVVEPIVEVAEINGAPKEVSSNTQRGTSEGKEFETIILATQTIKSPDNKKNKSNYALYGFVGFCFLLGILFVLRKRKYKNEFR